MDASSGEVDRLLKAAYRQRLVENSKVFLVADIGEWASRPFYDLIFTIL